MIPVPPDLIQLWDSLSASLDFLHPSSFTKLKSSQVCPQQIQKLLKKKRKEGHRKTLGLGYTYSFDNRRTGLDPKAGMFLRLSQDFDLTGDVRFVRTGVTLGGETYLRNEDFKVTATLQGGALNFVSGNSSRVTDRFFLGSGQFRGFSPGGVGPREFDKDSSINDALGGEYYAVARFETQFPIGLPEECWVASRKATVVKAVRFGLISLEEACSLYDLTQDEYSSWQTAVARHGESALRATALKKYRQFDQ